MKTINNIHRLYDFILARDIWYLNGGVIYPKQVKAPKDINEAVANYKERIKSLEKLEDEVSKLEAIYGIENDFEEF